MFLAALGYNVGLSGMVGKKKKTKKLFWVRESTVHSVKFGGGVSFPFTCHSLDHKALRQNLTGLTPHLQASCCEVCSHTKLSVERKRWGMEAEKPGLQVMPPGKLLRPRSFDKCCL